MSLNYNVTSEMLTIGLNIGIMARNDIVDIIKASVLLSWPALSCVRWTPRWSCCRSPVMYLLVTLRPPFFSKVETPSQSGLLSVSVNVSRACGAVGCCQMWVFTAKFKSAAVRPAKADTGGCICCSPPRSERWWSVYSLTIHTKILSCPILRSSLSELLWRKWRQKLAFAKGMHGMKMWDLCQLCCLHFPLLSGHEKKTLFQMKICMKHVKNVKKKNPLCKYSSYDFEFLQW